MNWVLFLTALILTENEARDPSLVGDQHLANKAYGLCQIRQPYLTDVNRIAGTSYTREALRRTVHSADRQAPHGGGGLPDSQWRAGWLEENVHRQGHPQVPQVLQQITVRGFGPGPLF